MQHGVRTGSDPNTARTTAMDGQGAEGGSAGERRQERTPRPGEVFPLWRKDTDIGGRTWRLLSLETPTSQASC